jgi:hypothetical protein
MMTAAFQDRKKGLLAICLCLFAISATYRLLNPYHQDKVARLTYTGSVSPAPRAEPESSDRAAEILDRDVWIELFLNPPEHSGKVQKNVFQRQGPPAPGSSFSEEPLGGEAQAAASPPTDKRLEVQEELSKFKSFGYMQGQGEKILFLERGKDILLIREGDRIDGKYLVKSITEKLLIIRAESIGEDVRIELGKF